MSDEKKDWGSNVNGIGEAVKVESERKRKGIENYRKGMGMPGKKVEILDTRMVTEWQREGCKSNQARRRKE